MALMRLKDMHATRFQLRDSFCPRRSVVCMSLGMHATLRRDVCTPFGFLYATLREPDSVHTAVSIDVDKTVAYGQPNGLHTTVRLDADRTVA